MPERWDVGVVGLGAMGSAIACELARRGVGVIGLDRARPPHALGSSHGETRIIREAYFEHALYVPLVQRAYERWDALAAETGTTLFRRTGGVMVGSPDSGLVRGARRSADLHGLDHEVLTASDVRARFPALRPDEDMVGVFEPRAGVLFPERCIEAHLRQGAALGATIRVDTAVTGWQSGAQGVTLVTEQGPMLVEQVVVAAGPWLPALVADLRLPLVVERNVVHWFSPVDHRDWFQPDALPIFMIEPARFSRSGKSDSGSGASSGHCGADPTLVYGIPEMRDVSEGVKVAFHHGGVTTAVHSIDREVRQDEVEGVRAAVRQYLPCLDGPWLRSTVCPYTNTPDGDFVIDRHPGERRLWIVSACSGHGFKFASALGELVADLLTGGRPRVDCGPFGVARFAATG